MNRFNTTAEFIASHVRASGYTAGAIITTEGYTTQGDRGGARWKATGNVIAASQDVIDLDDILLSDASGNEFQLVGEGVIDLNALGGTTNAYAVIATSAGLTYVQDLDVVTSSAQLTGTAINMISNVSLEVGNFVITSGYTSNGDGGDNTYEIVAAATGTDDGGSFIDLTGSGFQAKGLFPGGIMYADQFGMPQGSDGVTHLQAALRAANGQFEVVLAAKTGYQVSDGFVVPANTTLTAYGATINVIAGANTLPLMLNGELDGSYPNRSAFSNITIRGGRWDCNGLKNAIAFGMAFDMTIMDVEIIDVKDGHAIELNAISQGVISNCICNVFTDSSPPARNFSEAIQLDGANVALSGPGNGFFPFFNVASFTGEPCEDINIDNIRCKNWPRIVGSHGHNDASWKMQQRITVDNIIGANISDAVIRPNGWDTATISNVNATMIGTLSSANGLDIQDCNNITCSNFNITALDTSTDNGVLILVDVETINNDITLTNININDFGADGYDIRNVFRLNITDGIVRNVLEDGCRIVNCDRVSMQGTILDNNGSECIQIVEDSQAYNRVMLTGLMLSGGQSNGVFANNANGLIINDCHFFDQTVDGIQITDCRHANISGNTFDGMSGIAILIGAGSDSSIIANNQAFNTVGTAVRLIATADNCIVTSNHISGSTIKINDSAAGTITANNQV